MIVKNGKKSVMAQLKVFFWHFTAGSGENHNKTKKSRCPGRDSNQALHKYISDELSLVPCPYIHTKW
jgi:hypothetical protein